MRNVKALIVLGVLAASCATSRPVPTEKLGSSQAAVRAATEVGAENNPKASLYLRFAQEELEQGKQLVSAGENEKAEMAFRRASADAELALALTRASAAEKDAKAATEALNSAKSAR